MFRVASRFSSILRPAITPRMISRPLSTLVSRPAAYLELLATTPTCELTRKDFLQIHRYAQKIKKEHLRDFFGYERSINEFTLKSYLRAFNKLSRLGLYNQENVSALFALKNSCADVYSAPDAPVRVTEMVAQYVENNPYKRGRAAYFTALVKNYPHFEEIDKILLNSFKLVPHSWDRPFRDLLISDKDFVTYLKPFAQVLSFAAKFETENNYSFYGYFYNLISKENIGNLPLKGKILHHIDHVLKLTYGDFLPVTERERARNIFEVIVSDDNTVKKLGEAILVQDSWDDIKKLIKNRYKEFNRFFSSVSQPEETGVETVCTLRPSR